MCPRSLMCARLRGRRHRPRCFKFDHGGGIGPRAGILSRAIAAISRISPLPKNLSFVRRLGGRRLLLPGLVPALRVGESAHATGRAENGDGHYRQVSDHCFDSNWARSRRPRTLSCPSAGSGPRFAARAPPFNATRGRETGEEAGPCARLPPHVLQVVRHLRLGMLEI